VRGGALLERVQEACLKHGRRQSEHDPEDAVPRTFLVTSLSISDPDEELLVALVLRCGRDGVWSRAGVEGGPLPPPTPENASEAAATRPTELPTPGLLAIWPRRSVSSACYL